MWLAPKAYRTAPSQGKTQDYVNQVMVPYSQSCLNPDWRTLMAALIGGYIAQKLAEK